MHLFVKICTLLNLANEKFSFKVSRCIFAPLQGNVKPEDHPIEKEKHMNQTLHNNFEYLFCTRREINYSPPCKSKKRCKVFPWLFTCCHVLSQGQQSKSKTWINELLMVWQRCRRKMFTRHLQVGARWGNSVLGNMVVQRESCVRFIRFRYSTPMFSDWT